MGSRQYQIIYFCETAQPTLFRQVCLIDRFYSMQSSNSEQALSFKNLNINWYCWSSKFYSFRKISKMHF